MTSGFQDKESGAYLRLQLDNSQPDYGSFVVAMPKLGLAWGAGPATVSPEPESDNSMKRDHSIELRYEGAGYLQAQALPDLEFGVNYKPAGAIQNKTLTLNGHIDPTHHTGSIELRLGHKHYHLSIRDIPHNSDKTVTAYLAAVKTLNWCALYGLGDDSLKNSTTQADFVQAMQANTAGGSISDATVTGSAVYTVSASGIGYATIPLTLAITGGTAPGTQEGKLMLIYNGGQWRVFSVDSP